MISKHSLAIAFLISAAAVPGFSQGAVDLSGTVTDANGAPLGNARVTLTGRNLAALTNSAGKYSLKDGSTALARPGSAPAAAELAGSGLRLRVSGAREKVSVAVFDLHGGKLRQALSADLSAGTYDLDPPAAGLPAGAYLAEVRVGASRHLFRVRSLGASDGSIGAAPAAAPASISLRKAAAAPETLAVVAVGYERGEKVVELSGTPGTQDFKLAAVKWANVGYRPAGAPACSRCILDVRKPATGSKWPVIIHFHGGGMTGGDRNETYGGAYNNFGQKYLDNGLMVVTPGYTLAGGGTTVWPQYLKDAATASAWVRKNIESYGGDPNSVFISGFSAGAYLTHMLSLDTTYLKGAGSDGSRFAGFISMSGQTRTHDNIRNDLKVSDIMKEKPYAMPMGQVRKTTRPWQIFVGSLEGGTIDSNKALYDALLAKGSTDVYFDIIPGQGHTCSDMGNATSVKRDKLLAFIAKYKAK